MDASRSPEDIIRIPSTPRVTEKLLERVRHPNQLDEVVKDLQMPPSLLNFYLATSVDLSSIGLGEAIHIPVQITEREGGRKSLYYLNPGEEVLAGIFVTNQGIALKFVKREAGSTLPAQSGDIYSLRIENLEKEVILQEQAELEVIGPSIGFGRISTKIAGVSYWILWSGISVTTPQLGSNIIYAYYNAIRHEAYAEAYTYLASNAVLGTLPLTEDVFLKTAQAHDAEWGRVIGLSLSGTRDTGNFFSGSFKLHVTRERHSYDNRLTVEFQPDELITYRIVSMDDI